jgi:FixJ family two-component response regulator
VTQAEQMIFIIDDDPSVRRGLTRVIRAAGMQTKSFCSAVEFLDSKHMHYPGCIVLDVMMPGIDGPALQEILSKAECCLPIIFLSAHGDVPITAAAMKKGAVDFLTKPVDLDDLLAAIHVSLAHDVRNREKQAETDSIMDKINLLTPREHGIMTYVITGMLNKRIAAELRIAEDTVKIHRGRVMHKLGIVSVVELVRLCEKASIPSAVAGEGITEH